MNDRRVRLPRLYTSLAACINNLFVGLIGGAMVGRGMHVLLVVLFVKY